jgi:hypothetical protein
MLSGVSVCFGSDVPPAVEASVRTLLAPFVPNATVLAATPLAIGIGNTSACAPLLAGLRDMGPEAFVVRSSEDGEMVCAAGNGEKRSPSPGKSIGTGFAAYALLEHLGFAFLHPLSPTVPTELRRLSKALDVRENPRLAFRGLHIHTQHPLELVEVLNGADAHMAASASANSSTVPWASMLGDVRSTFEWLVANRQNRVQWALLHTEEWDASNFTSSPLRQARLRNLTALAHAFGLSAGVDVPIALM